jgi:hypothetical protein
MEQGWRKCPEFIIKWGSPLCSAHASGGIRKIDGGRIMFIVSYNGRLKVFSEQADAMGLARQCAQDGDNAHVYTVPSATNAWAAKAAIEMGAGTLIAAPSRRLTQPELAEREKQERDAQRRQSIREAAAWRVVRDFFGEHNALIDQNKPGILKDINGNTKTTQLRLPESGRGSRKLRRKFIAAVLTSQKPDTIRRFREAMAAEESARGR